MRSQPGLVLALEHISLTLIILNSWTYPNSSNLRIWLEQSVGIVQVVIGWVAVD
jgi:hypothetical protein